MGVYVGGGSGSGDTHVGQVISGGKKPKAQKRTGIVTPVKKATKAAVPRKKTGR